MTVYVCGVRELKELLPLERVHCRVRVGSNSTLASSSTGSVEVELR